MILLKVEPTNFIVMDLMSGKIGLVTEEDICTIEKEGGGDDYTISINPMEDFGVAIPAFAHFFFPRYD